LAGPTGSPAIWRQDNVQIKISRAQEKAVWGARSKLMRERPAYQRFQLQMPPDLQGQTWMLASRACASTGLRR
jgi:hypothetical protein